MKRAFNNYGFEMHRVLCNGVCPTHQTSKMDTSLATHNTTCRHSIGGGEDRETRPTTTATPVGDERFETSRSKHTQRIMIRLRQRTSFVVVHDTRRDETRRDERGGRRCVVVRSLWCCGSALPHYGYTAATTEQQHDNTPTADH